MAKRSDIVHLGRRRGMSRGIQKGLCYVCCDMLCHNGLFLDRVHQNSQTSWLTIVCLSIKLIKIVIFWNIPPIFGQSPASNRPFVRFMAFVRNTRQWSLRRSWVDGWKWKVVLIRRHGHGARQRFSTEPEKVWQKFSKMAQESKFTC